MIIPIPLPPFTEKGIGAVHDAYKTMKYSKKSTATVRDVRDKLDELDTELWAIYNRIQRSDEDGKDIRRRGVQTIRDRIGKFSSTIKTPRYMGALKLRAERYEIAYRDLTGISTSLDPVMDCAAKISGKTPMNELEAIDDYLSRLERMHSKVREHSINFDSCLRSFEEAHPGTNLAKRVKAKRIAAFTPIVPKQADTAVFAYLSNVRATMEKYEPCYVPRPEGRFLENGRWKVSFDAKDHEVVGQHKTWIFGRPDLTMVCHYDKPEAAAKIAAKAKKLSNSRQYAAECWAFKSLPDNFVKLIEEWKDDNLSVYCYDVRTGELHYNKNNAVAGVFAGYFQGQKSNEKPPDVKGILQTIADKDGDIHTDKLKQSLNIDSYGIKQLRDMPELMLYPSSEKTYRLGIDA